VTSQILLVLDNDGPVAGRGTSRSEEVGDYDQTVDIHFDAGDKCITSDQFQTD